MSRYVKVYRKVMNLQRRKTPMPWTPTFLEFSREPSVPFPLREKLQPAPIDLSYYLNMEVGDLVEVLHGPDCGRQGVVLSINKKRNTVIVDGCNMKKSFWNPRVGSSLVTQEMPIHITNVALLDPVVKRPTRVKRRFMMNGECVRISKLSEMCLMPAKRSGVWSLSEGRQAQTPNLYQEYLRQKALGPPIKASYARPDPLNLKILQRLARHIAWGQGSPLPTTDNPRVRSPEPMALRR
ncbi:putative ribosomal protein L24 [Neospora caninum Liverpool]|uniref:Large ribosomal subunit protein uL24c n=1 Tax=Neospora caninum (strain Liverpool) TaxID=572307 RepID=F0VDP9_NEOCL|nr:putative ribosomal protein L24 [Neospora caninum Liverpool]CBZ51842.1 putative ribosomal protein L24 [Neospora caninum Liverpool]|eukprot:XP_003881875.1 putative ribosomal protein L24 [Neospora caninum Liverpool]